MGPGDRVAGPKNEEKFPKFSKMVEGLDQRKPTNLSVFTRDLDNICRYRSSACPHV